ncbi:MAG: SDR family NAD(P)-dependent oxidoreductase [Candidatus Competibacteraceae bacterium]
MIEASGSVDILANNAASKRRTAVEMSLADWQRVLDINLTGQFLCPAPPFANSPSRRGAGTVARRRQDRLHFVGTMSSPWADTSTTPPPRAGEHDDEDDGPELAPQRIRVNAISPGAIKTRSTPLPG